MGCTSSKQVEVTAIDVYRPAPSSFAVFDINAVQEPWQQQQQQQQEDDEVDDEELKKKTNNPTRVTAPIFEKLNTFELVSDAPQSWEEISKALENLKPNLQATATPPKSEETVHSPAHDSSASPSSSPLPMKRTPRKSFSFHTLDELDAKTIFKKPTTELKKSESMKNITEFKKPELKRTELKKSEWKKGESTVGVVETETEGVRRLRENVFILKDKLEREREGKEAKFEKLMMSRRDPLSGYPEKCPPNAADSVVLYTTSLGGVRRTYEDCNRARSILEGHRVVFDERDVSLHGGFLNELKELLGEGASVPRLFVKGRYVGGVEEVVELNELGKLGRILSWARVERGVGRQVCEGCGGARFVPCLECGGSCKVYVGGGGGGGGGDKTKKKERCPKCNENGLVHCPFCIMI